MIEIVKMGEDAYHDETFTVDRPNGFPEYLLIISRTPGRFLVNGAWADYLANCAVIFKPYQKQAYTASGDCYIDCWMHFTSDRMILDDHFPFGTPIPLQQPEEIFQLFHIICSQYYGVSSHRDSLLSQLVDSLAYMISDENKTAPLPEIYYQLISLRKEIYWKPAEKWTVPYMAKKLNISAGYLHAIYQEYFHTTCMKEVIISRIKYACELLASCNLSVLEVAEQCGYNSVEHFIRQFKSSMGITPAQYRKKHAVRQINP